MALFPNVEGVSLDYSTGGIAEFLEMTADSTGLYSGTSSETKSTVFKMDFNGSILWS